MKFFELQDAVNKRHVKNTDTGTVNQTFDIDLEGANPVKIKNNDGTIELRNNADSDFADLQVKNLTVNGTRTVVNSTDMSVVDNVITVNKNETGEGVTLGLAGIEVERGSLSNARLIWDESNKRWKAGVDGSEENISLGDHTHDVLVQSRAGDTLGVIQSVAVPITYILKCTSLTSRSLYITDNGVINGNPIFNDLSKCAIHITPVKNTTSNTDSPWAYIRSIDVVNNLINIQIKRSNTGSILLGGSYSGNDNESGAMDLIIQITGEKKV